VVVLVTAAKGRLRIEVTDDGVGLDSKARNAAGTGASVHDSLPDASVRCGRGLENMRRRASALGGTARIVSSAQGRGTSVVVEVPAT